MPPDEPGTPKKKRANGLVAASCAGVLAVYSAGYVRTKSAVDRFEAQAAERRAAFPDPSRIVGYVDGRREAMREEPATARTVKPKARALLNKPPVFRSLEPPVPPAEALAAPSTTLSSEVRAEKAVPPAQPAKGVQANSSIQSFVSIVPEPLAPTLPASPGLSMSTASDPAAPTPPESKWKDGTYLGWGTSRHGNIQAEVIIEHGRILSATIAQCRTRYSCSVIDRLPPQVAQRQSRMWTTCRARLRVPTPSTSLWSRL